jgi:hypothetical protein
MLKKSTNSREAKAKIDQRQRRKAGTEILMRLLKSFKEASGGGGITIAIRCYELMRKPEDE